MADIELDNYYNRYNPAKQYEEHLFRAGNVLQSAELNEIQACSAQRHRMMGDALFKDGDIVRDARVIVDSVTGAVIAESGAIYLDGQVRGVPPANFTIPLTGTVVIGIYLLESIVTEQEDPELAEPATDVRAYGEPGAARLKVVPIWGIQGERDDAEFYPIYYVDDGQLRAKEAPPVLDAVSQAIARYDIDSSGSNYVVEGMLVRRLSDEGTNQVYTVDDGRARVNGFGVNLTNSRRLVYQTEPVIKLIDSEPTTSTSATLQHVTFARPPARDVVQVRITEQSSATMTHASFSGGADPLPDTSVVQIMSVTQGGTTFVEGADYVLTGQTVDWSPAGNEPAPGSTYQVVYRHISTAQPQNLTAKGFDVAGAVVGSLILTTYNCMLPRIDRLCIDDSGQFVWVQGVSTDYNPVRPSVPSTMIALAQVQQNWDDTTVVNNDGVRTVSMREIETMFTRMDQLTDLVAQQLLISDVSTREAAAKKGIFSDPFLNDNHRDIGVAQTAAISSGVLTLPIIPAVRSVGSDIETPQKCAFEIEVVIDQAERTGTMKVNPYMAFDVPAAPVTLNPSVDRWTETSTQWLSDVTQKFIAYDPGYHYAQGSGRGPTYVVTSQNTNLVSSKSTAIAYLRQIPINFTITGFGPGETLTSVTFDGIPVTPV
ncbi:hypothetical protein FHR70_000765 [Microvirga lupini]|uniref:DUF4815 domain-containing protein n=1 Tax=Microvirga lupini TaxID=420324 RepID=A0A7W4VI96_9HYPH|nr:DUF4815 domain-containing protein [Microvirga lupini]MBB3017725.1 hypothetical protein [Microvirga lupini]